MAGSNVGLPSVEFTTKPFSEQYKEPIEPELQLPERWIFTEQYEDLAGGKQFDVVKYKANMQKIGCFNDVVTFWQCWNNIGVNNLKTYFYNHENNSIPVFNINGQAKRVTTINMFKSGIEPAWEDEQNKDGGEYQIKLENVKNLDLVNEYWEKLVLEVITQEFPHSDQITGVRITDRSRGNQEMFRLEIWTRFNQWDSDESKAMATYLNDNYVALLGIKGATFIPHKS